MEDDTLRDDRIPLGNAAQRHRRNALPPIFSLPDDILILIFREISQGMPISALRTLIRVCKPWCNLIAATPLLWTTIHSLNKPFDNQRIIQRSLTTPLHIYYKRDFTYPSPISALTRFLAPFQSHIRRWVTLDIFSCRGSYDSAFTNIVSDAISLRYCCLSFTREDWVEHREWVRLPSDAPFKTLIISGLPVLWGECHGKDLLYLSIVDVTLPPSIYQLLHILATAPGIQRLNLSVSGRSCLASRPSSEPQNTSESTSSSEPIILHDLMALDVVAVPPFYLERLLSSIMTPSLACSYIRHAKAEDLTISVQQVLTPFVLRMQGVDLKVDNEGVEMKCPGGCALPSHLLPRVLFNGRIPLSGLHMFIHFITQNNWCHIASFLRNVAEMPLHLTLQLWYPTEGPDAEVEHSSRVPFPYENAVQDFVQTKKLTIGGLCGMVSGLVGILARPGPNEAWPLPILEELVLESRYYKRHEVIAIAKALKHLTSTRASAIQEGVLITLPRIVAEDDVLQEMMEPSEGPATLDQIQ